MVNVSKVFVALLVCFMMKECMVCADPRTSILRSSNSSNSGSSVSSDDDECGRGFVRCKTSGGEIGCVKLCSNSMSKCEQVDVDEYGMCCFIDECLLTSTLVVEVAGKVLIASCSGSESSSCFGLYSIETCDSEGNCARGVGRASCTNEKATVPRCAISCTISSTGKEKCDAACTNQ